MSFLEWSGAALWCAIALAAGWVVAVLVRDGMVCAVYVRRYRRAAGWKPGVPIWRKARAVFVQWFRLWSGMQWRPDRTRFEDGTVIYWPGHEGPEKSFPA